MNKVMLIGNVGQEPLVRYLDGGTCVAQISLATTEKGYTLQNGTVVPDRTEWHTVIFWRKQAETIEKYVHKGDKLYVEGKIQSRNYDDPKTGQRRKVVEIMAENMEMLTTKAQSMAHAESASGASASIQQEPQTVQSAQPTAPAAPSPTDKYPF